MVLVGSEESCGDCSVVGSVGCENSSDRLTMTASMPDNLEFILEQQAQFAVQQSQLVPRACAPNLH
jgi:hypothetical protein